MAGIKIHLVRAGNLLRLVVLNGAVTGSTGMVRLDQRAEEPGLYKTGNLKITDNDNLVLAAA